MFHILSITPFPLFPASSGGQKKTFGLLQALGKTTKLTAITTSDSVIENNISFTVLPILKSNKFKYLDIRKIKTIAQICRDKEIDIIILDQPFLSWLPYFLSISNDKKFIIHSHNIETNRFKSFRKWWASLLFYYERWAFSKAWKIVFISQEDAQTANRQMGIPLSKSIVAPYGTWQKSIPKLDNSFRKKLYKQLNTPFSNKLIMFFGVLSYQPNWEAVDLIINKINPILKKNKNLNYTILLCGKGLPKRFFPQIENENTIIHLGFLDDINKYTQSVDVVLNPVLSGGGMKTKVIEAIAFNKTVVSTQAGAIGIEKSVCGAKLLISENHNWKVFSENILKALTQSENTPQKFYKTYNLDEINFTIMKQLEN